MLNTNRLVSLLAMPRMAGPLTTSWFRSWLNEHAPTLKFTEDLSHNFVCFIGGIQRVIMCAHYDTVDTAQAVPLAGLKTVLNTGDILTLDPAAHQPLGTQCLGADDAAGIELLLCMAEAGVPGCYMMCADEEHGRNGSRAAARNMLKVCPEVDHVISFDRAGYGSFITHQMNLETASATFCSELQTLIPGIPLHLDDGGCYTDSLSFAEAGYVEATNISVGYTDAHKKSELLDLRYLRKLEAALTQVKSWDSLSAPALASDADAADENEAVVQLCYTDPDGVADFIIQLGLGEELINYHDEETKAYKAKKKQETYDKLWPSDADLDSRGHYRGYYGY